MIPDNPIIHFGKHDACTINADIRGTRIINTVERLKKQLKRLRRRLHEVREPEEWRPIGYEW